MSINTLQDTINIFFKNQNILREALTHKSYLNENPDWNTPHNERLEFLGDAVLELVVTNYLFKTYPKIEEGELTQIRAALVNSKMLAEVAETINLKSVLLVSKGEQFSDRSGEAIISDAFEALVGAIYLDSGYQVAESFIRQHLLALTDSVRQRGVKDAKSVLQELSQSLYRSTPSYGVLKEEGPEHSKKFTAGVYIGEKMIAMGDGLSKQEAEINAAKNALLHKDFKAYN